MLLGHYIQHHIRWNLTKTLAVAIPLLVGGFLITYSGYSYIMGLPDKTPEQVELFWTYNSPNVAMMTIACFLMVYRIKIAPDSRIAAWLANLTTCGFGIYMIHYIFIGPAVMLLSPLGLPTPLCVIFTVAIVFATSWVVTNTIYKLLPKAARYIVG
jgi:surface polysaccharide O-acyltransferase-like enzyme